MTKTDRKYAARDAIMHAMNTAFYELYDQPDSVENEYALSALEVEYRRVEKFLGYEPGSWTHW